MGSCERFLSSCDFRPVGPGRAARWPRGYEVLGLVAKNTSPIANRTSAATGDSVVNTSVQGHLTAG